MQPERASEPTRRTNERIVAAQGGDAEALRQLVLTWQPRARNLVRYLVRGDDQVDDFSQQALLVALEKLHDYRGEGSPDAWLDGIVLRVTLRAMRRIRWWRARSVEHIDDRMLVAVSQAARYPDRRKLVLALDRLPEKQRAALVMHHVLGMSAPEIAALENIPEETAKSRLKHGMALLRTELGPERENR